MRRAEAYAEHFACLQLAHDSGTAALQQDEAVANEALQHEALAAEEARGEALRKVHLDGRVGGAGEERTTLTDLSTCQLIDAYCRLMMTTFRRETHQLAAELIQPEREHLRGVIASEGDLRDARRVGVSKVGDEKGFAREHALQARLEAVGLGLHLHALGHVQQRADLCTNDVLGEEVNFHHLGLVAEHSVGKDVQATLR